MDESVESLLPMEESEPGDEPAVLPSEVARPRFCGRCGMALDLSGEGCRACAATPVIAPVAAAAPARPVAPALALYFVLLGSSLVAILAILAGANAVDAEIATIVLDALVVLIWCLPARKQVASALSSPAGMWWYPAALAGAVGTFIVATAALWGLGAMLGIEQLSLSKPLLDHGLGWAGVIVMVCVQPAIIEELAFRGIIFGSLRRALSANETIMVSACMFSILHLSIPGIPHLLVIGLALGYLRSKSGSLYPGMVLHFTHNLLCVLSEQKGW